MNRRKWWILTAVAASLLIAAVMAVFSTQTLLEWRLSSMHVGVHCDPAEQASIYFRCKDHDVPKAVDLLTQYLASRKASPANVWILDPVGDQGLKAILKMPGVTTVTNLNIQARAITNSGLDNLGQVTNLRFLRVHSPLVDCEGLKSLTALQSLEYLELGGTGVTDECLPLFAKLPKLDALNVYDTRITKEAAASFQQLRPDVSVGVGVIPAGWSRLK